MPRKTKCGESFTGSTANRWQCNRPEGHTGKHAMFKQTESERSYQRRLRREQGGST